MIAGQGKKKYLEVDNQRGEGIYDDNSQARWCWYFMYLPWYSLLGKGDDGSHHDDV